MGEGCRSNCWLSCRSSIFGQVRLTEIFKAFHIWETGQWAEQNPVPSTTWNQYLLFMGALHLTIHQSPDSAHRLHLICLLSTLEYPALVIQSLVRISRSTVGTVIILVLLYKFHTLNLVSISAKSLQQSICKFKGTQEGCTFSFHEHP